ncbi:phosphohistidine phosphatase SixA [Aphanothece sacrum]|nr:phosphohistidine phosphatase SixA [Aphanothece sacrum]
MTQIYLIRHGIAVERNEDIKDETRPLTDKGRQKTTEIGQKLGEMGVKFDIILSSPLVRAWETAEILQKAKLSEKISEFAPLAPGGSLQAWVNWWLNSCYNKDEHSLALVGHQPDLGEWAELLIWGSSRDKITVKKAGIIGLTLPQTVTPIGQGELFLLTSPKWLL